MRRFRREYAYVVSGAFLAVPTFVLALLALVFAVLSLLTVGLPFLGAALWLGRGSIYYFRRPANALLGWDWPDPRPVRVLGVFRDSAGWKALAYCFMTFPIKVTAAYLGAAAMVSGLVLAAYPAWWFLSPTGWGHVDPTGWGGTWWVALQGLATLVVTPWFVRLLVLLDKPLAYALLSPGSAQERIAQLEAGRAALQEDALTLLRRVERDLHDGTQARLVSLGVALSRIGRRATDDESRLLITAAQATVTDALNELRDIVRGMYPPALDDGLDVALSTLAARSAVPVQVSVSLSGRPPDATASAVYFAVAELLTNITRHAAATRAWVDLSDTGTHLHLTVRDNGRGGAAPVPVGHDPAGHDPAGHDPAGHDPAGHDPTSAVITNSRPASTAPTNSDPTSTASTSSDPASTAVAGTAAAGSGPAGTAPTRGGSMGTGLTGLARRAAALDGALTIHSPSGGPTSVTVTFGKT